MRARREDLGQAGPNEPLKITIPDFCLVVLIGAHGAGKSTFARAHFKPTEIIGSHWARGFVDDDENNRAATKDAFDVLCFLAEKRLKRRRLVLIDATNARTEDRARLVNLARRYHASPVAIVLNPGEAICSSRTAERQPRPDPELVSAQVRSIERDLPNLAKEGFGAVFTLTSDRQANESSVVRERLAPDLRHLSGPFDIIGDVHGCVDELTALLERLGYRISFEGQGEARRAVSVAPPGRCAIFVGDLVDRGPNTPDTLRIVTAMVEAGHGMAVPGNHDVKFSRWLGGRHLKLTHGLAQSAEQMQNESISFRAKVKTFLDGLVSHLWLDGGRLVVAHAGIKEDMVGRTSSAVREFCLYGETSGETDEFGLPIRYHWAAEYRGAMCIVYGHTPVPEAQWLNNTLCIDTGCCFGGKLTALRWPEKEIISVPAAKVYSEPIRPFGHPPVRPGATVLQEGDMKRSDGSPRLETGPSAAEPSD